ncbi:MAG: DUF1565 domain-containing protein [Candidatus Saganbacteria bacterium]|nr:DUF1565 domain-containing protein [Candidatus Saganbacteria bacterium]
MRKIIISAIISASIFCGVSAAADYYVDASTTEGNVVGDGSSGNPWQTITHAINNSIAGDTINVLPGTYKTGMTGSSESFPLTVTGKKLLATSTRLATIEENSAAITILSLGTNTTIEGFYIKGNGSHRVMDITADTVCVRNNTINADNYSNAIYAMLRSSVFVDDNIIHSMEQVGVVLDSVNTGSLARNEIRDAASGLYFAVYAVGQGIVIDRNTIVRNYKGLYVMASGGTITVKNNIISNMPRLNDDFSQGNTGIQGGGGTINLSYNNVWKNSTNYTSITAGVTDISEFPGFVSPESNDFRLQASNPYWTNPCIGSGEGGVDIGCYGSVEAGVPYRAESYVNGSGSDSTGTGTSESKAWRSLTRANKYTVNVINVGSGLYNAAGGETSFPMKFSINRYVKGAGRSSATIEAGSSQSLMDLNRYSSIEGLTLKGGSGSYLIQPFGSVIIKDCYLNGASYTYGIYGNNYMNYATVEACRIASASYGMLFNSLTYGWIISNEVVSCTNQGLRMINGTALIKKNLIRNTTNTAVYSEGATLTVQKNTIVKNLTGVWANSSGNVTISSNIIAAAVGGYPVAGTKGIYKSGPTVTSKYNDVYANATNWSGVASGEGDITRDPKLLDATNNDYHLLYNSPCIDSGTGEADPDGSRADMGCYPFDLSVSGTMAVYVKEPDGGESLTGNATYEITWYATKEGTSIDHIELAYSINNGSTWVPITGNTTNDGSYIWTAPNVTTTEGLIKVTAVGSLATDESDNPFSITSSIWPGPDYYVDASATTGNLTGNGSLTTPWQTLTFALAQVGAGDSVYVLPGAYNESMSGSSEIFPIVVPNSVEVVAMVTHEATVEASSGRVFTLSLWSTIEGLTVKSPGPTTNDNGAIYLNGRYAHVLTNILTCSATSARGIYIPNTAGNSRIIGNQLYLEKSSTKGIYSYDSSQTSYLTISDNLIKVGSNDNAVAIDLDREEYVLVSNNTIEVGVDASGIESGTYSSHYTITNNRIRSPGGTSVYQTGVSLGYQYNGTSVTSNEIVGFLIGIKAGLYNQISGSYSQQIIHNTVVDCQTGIYCQSRSNDPDNYFTVKNNLVSRTKLLGELNSGTNIGIHRQSGSVTATYNDVWNFNIPYYDENPGVSPPLSQSSNISRYPRFVNAAAGDYRLCSDSPCAAAGEAGTYQGCYPASGIASAVLAESWVDAVGGNDATGNGSSGSPWKSFTRALSSTEGTVHAKAGTYNTGISESFPLQLSENQQIHSEAGTSAVIDTANHTAVELGHLTTIEGMMIKTSGGNSDYGAVYLRSPSDVLTNTISCSATNARGVFLTSNADRALVKYNTIWMGGDNYRGIELYNTCNYVTVEANTIEAVGAGTINYGIHLSSNADHPRLANNRISVGANADGIYLYDSVSDYLISGNIIRGVGDTNNSGIHCRDYMGNGAISCNDISDFGYGLYVEDINGTMAVENNTLVDALIYGIWSSYDGTMNVKNNIISRSTLGGTYGIYHDASGGAVNSTYNDIWNYTTQVSNYVTTGNGTKSVDPRFVNAAADDYHLNYNSPCIDAGDPAGAEMGAYPFTGSMAAYVIQPNGGEALTGYDSYYIQWYATKEGLPYDHIELYLSTDGGASFPVTIDNNTANDGSYLWSVHNLPTIEARIKLIAVGSSVTDESDGDFTILNGDLAPPSVEVTVPSDGLVWPGGSQRDVIFSCFDNRGIKADSIDLYYTTGEGWVSIDTDQPTNAAYAWTLPLLNTDETKVRITVEDINDNTGTGESLGFFTIDSTSPSATSIILRDLSSGLTTETNELTVSVEAVGVVDGPVLMRLAENSGFTLNSTGWVSYANPTTFAFSWGNGTREVYYQLRDAASNESQIYSGSIIVDIRVFYVDAINGSNSNTGSIESDAWKTITYALSTTETDNIILCSAGTYDASNGETFPLNIDDNKLVSGESAAVCFIIGKGSPPVVLSGGGEIKNFTIMSTSLTIGDAAVLVNGAGNVTGNNITWYGTAPAETIGVKYDAGSSGIASLNTIYEVSTGMMLDTTGGVTADHNTIASFDENGILMDKGTFTITNNIVCASPNLDEISDNSIGINNTGTALVSADYNDVWGNTTAYKEVDAGDNSLNAFACFVDPRNNDYRIYDSTIYASSPLKDAGSDGQTIGAYTDTLIGGSVYRDTGYVDAVNGADDISKGIGTGSNAYATLDFANRYIIDVIEAAEGTYDLGANTLALADGKLLDGASHNNTTITGTSGTLLEMANDAGLKDVAIFSSANVPDAKVVEVNGDNVNVENSKLSFNPTNIPGNSTLIVVTDQADGTNISGTDLRYADRAVLLNKPATLDSVTITNFNDYGILNNNTGTSKLKDSIISQSPNTASSLSATAVGIEIDQGEVELARVNFDRTINKYDGQIKLLDKIYHLDPLFLDPATGDLSLKSNSPLIGLGEEGSTLGAWQPDYSNDFIACHITAPDGGEILSAGENYQITWYASKGVTPIDSISLYYSFDSGTTYTDTIATDLTNSGGTNSAVTGVFDWTVPNVETTTAKIKVLSFVGTGTASDASNSDFSIRQGGETEPPNINVRVGGFTIISKDYIDRNTTFDIYLTDNTSLAVSSTNVNLDGLAGSYIVVSDKGSSAHLQLVASAMDNGDHDLKVEAYDIYGNVATKEINDLKVESGPARVIGPVLVQPTPYAPMTGQPATIAYHLNKNVDTTLYIYSPVGIEWTRKYPAGQNGGKAGYDAVDFFALSDKSGDYFGNGIYVIKFVAENKVIGKGYVVIYD